MVGTAALPVDPCNGQPFHERFIEDDPLRLCIPAPTGVNNRFGREETGFHGRKPGILIRLSVIRWGKLFDFVTGREALTL